MLRKFKNRVKLYFTAPSKARVGKAIREGNRTGIISQKFFDGLEGYMRDYSK